MIAGMTVRPARSTRAAPSGTSTEALSPTAVSRSSSTTRVPVSMTSPLPTMTRAPS